MEQIKLILQKKDMKLFSTYLDQLKGDLNRYILIESDSATKLNLLHILSGLEPSTIFLETCIRELLSRPNADVNATAVIDNNYGLTAAHIAVQWHHISILKILVEYTPDLLKCDSFGKTVQDYAEEERDEEMMNIVEKGIEKWYNFNYDQYQSILQTFCKPSNRYSFSNGKDDINSIVEEDFNERYFSNQNLNRSIYKTPIKISSNRSFSFSEGNDKVLNVSEGDTNNCCFDNRDPNETLFQTPMQATPTSNYSSNSISSSSIQTMNSSKQNVLPPYNIRVSAGSGISYMPSSFNSSLDSLASEVYLYKDEDYNIQFLEERFNGAPRLIDEQRNQLSKAESNQGEFSSPNRSGNASSSFNRSTESIESTIDELILKMTNTQLFDHLVEKGEKPGPVNDRTKRLYQKRASRLKKQGQITNSSFLDEIKSTLLSKTIVKEVKDVKEMEEVKNSNEDEEEAKLMAKLASYPLEFTNLVKRKFPFEEAISYERMLIKVFDAIESRYDDGPHCGSSTKNTYFSYLLLDPAITDNLPVRANMCLEMLMAGKGNSEDRPNAGLLELLDPKLFGAFILAIFYVGKGTNARAYAHFYEAFKAMDPSFNKGPRATGGVPPSAKVEKICSIWRTGKGPISLHCFQGISEDEALTREALMIDVLSLSNLTNSISGSYRYDLKLNKRQRNILGTYLLFKAFIILLLNGERQVKMPEKL